MLWGFSPSNIPLLRASIGLGKRGFMATTNVKQLAFHVLVSEEEGAHVARCLETGLVAVSQDQDDAVSKMTKLITRQVEFALKHDRLADIYRPVPNEVFKQYVLAKGPSLGSSQKPMRLDHVGGLMVTQSAYAAANC